MKNKDDSSSPSFRVHVTLRFVLFCFVVLPLLSFGLGQICRAVVLRGLLRAYTNLYGPPPLFLQQKLDEEEERRRRKEEEGTGIGALPQPVLSKGKRMPKTIYTSKHFSTGLPATSDNLLLSRRSKSADPEDQQSFEITADGESLSMGIAGGDDNDDMEDDGEEEIHYPKGQHLIVDIENVDGTFLNSEERLAKAMMDLVTMSGLTLLSYHCHSLEPMGVSCVGILLESHVSFHTWPVPGVITFDIFTCGESPLAPLLGSVEDKFGIPRTPTYEGEKIDPPRTLWMFKKRGFDRQNDAASNPEEVEFGQYLAGWMEFELKKEVVSVQTNFQQIDIFDVINPRFHTLESYKRSLSNDGSYESQHPELFLPDRIVYLDHVMQSRRYGDSAYHETLVHPAMFAHDEPKRVAIIGGGEGATLREVLKHRTVEQVIMVEIDEIMVNVSRQFLPEWSDCSNIQGSTGSCFDDPRAQVYYEDAIAWFITRFGKNAKVDPAERFDVIIMDAL